MSENEDFFFFFCENEIEVFFKYMSKERKEEIFKSISEEERERIEKQLNELKSKEIKKNLIIPILVFLYLFIFLTGSKKIKLAIIILTPLVLFGGATIFYIKKYINSMKLSCTAKATVTEVKRDKYTERNSNGKNVQKTKYEITYKYTVNDKEYIGFCVSGFSKNLGQNIKIHYDPNNPKNCETAIERTQYIFIIAIFVIAFALALCIPFI